MENTEELIVRTRLRCLARDVPLDVLPIILRALEQEGFQVGYPEPGTGEITGVDIYGKVIDSNIIIGDDTSPL